MTAIVASLVMAGVILLVGALACVGIEGWYWWSSRRSGARRRMGLGARLAARIGGQR